MAAFPKNDNTKLVRVQGIEGGFPFYGNLETEPISAASEYQEEGGLYLTSEGEAVKDSYINLFVNQFWNGKLLAKWDKIQYKYFDNEVELVDRLYDFYSLRTIIMVSPFMKSYNISNKECNI